MIHLESKFGSLTYPSSHGLHVFVSITKNYS